MSVMQSEVFEALRSINVPEEKAVKAAEALAKPGDALLKDVANMRAEVVATVTPLSLKLTDLDDIVKNVKSDTSTLKSEMMLVKWMMGFILAFQAAIFAKMFIH